LLDLRGTALYIMGSAHNVHIVDKNTTIHSTPGPEREMVGSRVSQRTKRREETSCSWIPRNLGRRKHIG
jgi:hypothetical protein